MNMLLSFLFLFIPFFVCLLPLSVKIGPFLNFYFVFFLLLDFPCCFALVCFLALPCPFSASKDDASDKTDGKIISIYLYTTSCFSFLVFFPFLSVHFDHVLLQCVATAPPAVADKTFYLSLSQCLHSLHLNPINNSSNANVFCVLLIVDLPLRPC